MNVLYVCVIYTHTSVCHMCCSCISMCAHMYMCVVCMCVLHVRGVWSVYVIDMCVRVGVCACFVCTRLCVVCCVRTRVCMSCACYMCAHVSYGLHVYVCIMSLCAHIADTRVIIPQIKENGTYLLYRLLPKIN